MKTNYRLLCLVLFLVGTLLGQDRFNSSYPRNVFFTVFGHGGGGFPTYSGGTWFQNNATKYDMIMIGASRDGINVAAKMREYNPNQILLTHYVPMYINDPVQFFLYRSYRGKLRQPVVPGQSRIYVDSVQGSNAGLTPGVYTYLYIVIDEDVVKVENIVDDTTFQVITDINAIEAINTAHAAGATVKSPLRASGPGVYPNFSEYCPVVNGQQAWDYLTEKFFSRHNWESGLIDGIFFDFFTEDIQVNNMTTDFDLDGLDDTAEHGREWINEKWALGRDQWLVLLRAGMQSRLPGGANKILLNNGGPLTDCYSLVEGHIFEGFLYFGGNLFSNYHNYFEPDYVNWINNGRKPSLMSIQDFIPDKWAADGKERFWKMRFGLTTSCIYEMYYGMAYTLYFRDPIWYDEMEADLGYPVDSQIITLPSGLVLRYFTNGVAVCNPTGQRKTLSAADLVGGPFYRMKGGQDPTFNTGEPFTSVELFGVIYNDTDWRGDGILLFRQPTTVVTDIIVDNFDFNQTSPSSNPIELTGSWTKKVTKGSITFDPANPYYVQDTSKLYDDSYGYQAISAGTGEGTATWRPTIGVPGWYEVAEWHPWHGDYPSSSAEATNVPFVVVADGANKLAGTINQQVNYGQWNRLGYVNLPQGVTSYIRITNNANGVVMADAMRFHYMGDNYTPNQTRPNPPTNVRLQQVK